MLRPKSAGIIPLLGIESQCRDSQVKLTGVSTSVRFSFAFFVVDE